MSHFKTVCRKCRIVMNQCRCPGPKEERLGLCQACIQAKPERTTQAKQRIREFVTESNLIEGILEVRQEELHAFTYVLDQSYLTVADLANYVNITANGARLRDVQGRDVRVGDHLPPRGGPDIKQHLTDLLDLVNANQGSPWLNHCQYEDLHPFEDGNGRSGRLVWAWQMRHFHRWPELNLKFLHAFYYQTLSEART